MRSTLLIKYPWKFPIALSLSQHQTLKNAFNSASSILSALLLLFLLCLLISFPLSLIFAYQATTSNYPGSHWLITKLIIPYDLSFLASLYAWPLASRKTWPPPPPKPPPMTFKGILFLKTFSSIVSNTVELKIFALSFFFSLFLQCVKLFIFVLILKFLGFVHFFFFCTASLLSENSVPAIRTDNFSFLVHPNFFLFFLSSFLFAPFCLLSFYIF